MTAPRRLDRGLDRALTELGTSSDALQKELDQREVMARLFGPPKEPPPRLGRFIVLGVLGRGGMGKVLRAYDDTLDRQVAIKLMHPERRARHEARLLREAQALAKLSHPNVVHVYEVGTIDDQTFVAMELVHGQTLYQWQTQRRPWRACLDAYLQAGRGLAAAHTAGLVHRDFKPSNCVMDEHGRVRVLDFGLVRGSGEEDESESPPGESWRQLDERLTATGSVLGTPAFIAPEQLARRPADARSDQFSFCISLFHALFGQPPFRESLLPWLTTEASDATPPSPAIPSGNRVPRALQRILARGMAPDPASRWPSMEALLQALERVRRRSWARRAALVSVPPLLGVGLTAALLTSSPCDDARERLGRAWNDTQRDRVHQAVLGTELPYAADTWTTLEGQLDAYAEGWMREQTAACEATRVHHEQSVETLALRERCLRRHRAVLANDVELLAQADATVVSKAVELVAALPRVERCANVDALEHDALPLRSPEHDAAADELRDELGQARSLGITGKHEEGLSVVEPLVESAEALGDHRLTAEALLVQGELHEGLEQYEEASMLLQRAQDLALEHGADDVAVAAMAGLVFVRGVYEDNTDVGLSIGNIAERLAIKTDFEGVLHAKVLTAIAQVYTKRRELDQGKAYYEQAQQFVEQLRGSGDIMLVEPLDGLAQIARRRHDLDEAEKLYQRALEIHTTQLGERHPDTAYEHTDLCSVLQHREDYARAEEHCRLALEILEQDRTTDRSSVADARNNLGTVLYRQGRHAEAEQELRAAIEQWKVTLGPYHSRLVAAYINLGKVHEKQGQIEPALEDHALALDVIEHQQDRAMRASLLEHLAKALESRPEGVAEAERLRDQARTLREELHEPRHP